MRDRLDEFGDATVAAVAFAPAHQLAASRDHLALPFPFLADPDRSLYHRFGLGRGTVRQVWNPGTLRMYARLLRRGRRLRRPIHDTRQLGGDFVIAPDGTLAAAFRPRSPDDRPPVDALVAAVAASRAATPGA